jgi:hypothetical protein
MPDAFTLTVPVAADFQALVPDVARRYAELSGAAAADRDALAEALRSTLSQLIDEVGAGASIVLEFRPSPTGVEVTARCGGRSVSVVHPLPTRSKP